MTAEGFIAGDLVRINDNGGWCWFQDERAVVDKQGGKLLIGSVAAKEGAGGEHRAGNIELAAYDLATGRSQVTVLHERLEVDDHDVPAIWVRPDGRYLAMYTKHNADSLSRWRITRKPHDVSEWTDERTFDWRSVRPGCKVTYSNVHHLSAEGRTYNFSRAINDDPSILISSDLGESWAYGGKLLTIPKIGYVNGYTRYASNGADRIDFITTEHHPRDFNNSIYHGYIQGGRLHRSDGTVIDDNVLDDDGRPQTELTRIFSAGTVMGGETMTHAWTADLRLDSAGRPVALLTCRANDEPENTNFEDHRLFYGRFDGRAWRVQHLAKLGARLYHSEQDYTGLGAIDPHDAGTVYVSTPIDPRSGRKLPHHEIWKAVSRDGGESWSWSAVTADSPVDNFRPIVPRWDAENRAVLWYRGTMFTAQNYNAAVVGIIERRRP